MVMLCYISLAVHTEMRSLRLSPSISLILRLVCLIL